MKKVAVILSGCGVYDGSEIHEAVLTLLSIKLAGADYRCFAPDIEQYHVVNHINGRVEENQTRNVLTESARITRGDIEDITLLDPTEFDALLIPGGFGAAKNLCDFAISGTDTKVNPDVLKVAKAFADVKKAAGYACIAPAMMPLVYGKGVRMTIGTDQDTAAAIRMMGADHVSCEVDDVVLDNDNRVVSTPAYMLATSIDEAYKGIQKWVLTVLALA
ncbi:isoprenoid biosynthesis glyoxalase ElbB [Neptunicella marina]|uniref:Glyoxalase n=1 Tax=Neptunicella marina TaxID=2125989 RepID=A0A8J6M5N7_9ALTE|nr:isoprenoid biosynthesis glyoxalase ElbB [Neptunicella marina]MBC3766626.1 isoprenoid biosynthesis glyoxalase ElbB [Neptunicella marina]